MGHLIDLPKEAAGQGLQALGPLGDGPHPSGNDPLLTTQADNSLVKQLNFPDGLLGTHVLALAGWNHLRNLPSDEVHQTAAVDLLGSHS